MDLQKINEGLEEIAQHAYVIYHNYAKAKAEFDNINEAQKLTLAVISTMKYEGSEATRKRQGEADKDYKDYIDKLNQARSKFFTAQASVKVLEAKLACYQSLSKNYLKENNLITSQA